MNADKTILSALSARRMSASIAVGFLLIAGGAARADETLDGEQMRALLFGNTLTGSHPSVGAVWNAYVAPDGAIHIKGARSEGDYEFFGQVTIEDDRWCEEWRIVNFQMKCRRITRDGETFNVVRDDGKVLSSFVVRPGDPEGLGGAAPAPAGTAETTEATAAATEAPEPSAIEPSQSQTAPPAPAPSGRAMNNDVVLRLHAIGQSDDSLVNLIQRSPTDFDLSPKAVEKLRKAGIGTPVISAMLAAKLGTSGATAAPPAPAAGESEQPAMLPKPKSQIDDTAPAAVAEPEPPVDTAAAETNAMAEPAAVEQPDSAAAEEPPPAEPAAVETAAAVATTNEPMPAGEGVYAMMAGAPMEIPATDVEMTVGLRISGSEKHTSAVDGFGASPPAVLNSAPASFIVNGADFDPRSLRLSQLGYMADRRADQFNLLGIEPAYFASVYGREPEEMVPVGLWRPKTIIDLIVEPVAGQTGMFRLTPTEPLPEGRYAFYQADAVHPYDEVFLTEGRRGTHAYYFAVGNP